MKNEITIEELYLEHGGVMYEGCGGREEVLFYIQEVKRILKIEKGKIIKKKMSIYFERRVDLMTFLTNALQILSLKLCTKDNEVDLYTPLRQFLDNMFRLDFFLKNPNLIDKQVERSKNFKDNDKGYNDNDIINETHNKRVISLYHLCGSASHLGGTLFLELQATQLSFFKASILKSIEVLIDEFTDWFTKILRNYFNSKKDSTYFVLLYPISRILIQTEVCLSASLNGPNIYLYGSFDYNKTLIQKSEGRKRKLKNQGFSLDSYEELLSIINKNTKNKYLRNIFITTINYLVWEFVFIIRKPLEENMILFYYLKTLVELLAGQNAYLINGNEKEFDAQIIKYIENINLVVSESEGIKHNYNYIDLEINSLVREYSNSYFNLHKKLNYLLHDHPFPEKLSLEEKLKMLEKIKNISKDTLTNLVTLLKKNGTSTRNVNVINNLKDLYYEVFSPLLN